MYIREKIEDQIRALIQKSLETAVEAGDFSLASMPEIHLEVPREKEHGDYATNVAMQLPKQAKKAPRVIAESIVKHFDIDGSYVEEIDIAGPGFINFRLKPEWIYEVLLEIKDMGGDYGRSTGNTGKKYNLEFISANPTGPMHMGNARGGAIGDILASIAQWTGYEVTREFYVNDAGNQIAKFGDSLDARFRQLMGQDIPFPEDGYQGGDIRVHMEEFIAKEGGEAACEKYLAMDEGERKKIFVDYALEKNLKKMHKDLEDYGIVYDVWFSEQSLYDSGAIESALQTLKDRSAVYEKEGALWFETSKYGCEKDDVLIRQNGLPTYFMGDIAYHLNKFMTRGFDRCVNVWGADHHGHIARLKAAMAAAGVNPDNLEIVIMQLVRLMRDGEIARMSKRKGEMISLTDLIEEVGRDAARFLFNMRSPDSHLDFDLDLAIEQSNENPVFYVQYAHARICSILRQMAEDVTEKDAVNLTLLKEKEEINLITMLANLPEEIIIAEDKMDPSRITRYAMDLASAFHSFYNACRVRVEDVALMKARLALIEATKQVLTNVLGILGVEAPERM
ncbi:MAG: arginine--tRNA ligase [Eubacterium sp.]|nr:arginine--tRNA ligase [Eubacterium sp.]